MPVTNSTEKPSVQHSMELAKQPSIQVEDQETKSEQEEETMVPPPNLSVLQMEEISADEFT